MSAYLLQVLVMAFALGIALESLVSVPLAMVGWLVLVAIGLVVVAWRESGALPPLRSFTFLLCTIAFSLGVIRMDLATAHFGHSQYASQVGESVTLTGLVVREPEVRENATHLYIRTDNDLILVTTDRYQTVQYGDQVTVEGVLKVPESFTTDLGREFNYPDYLKARGVEYRISFATVTVAVQNQGNQGLAFLFLIKEQLMFGIEQALVEPQAGLAEGLLLGVKQALGDELEEDFRKAGIIHIVVLSGYNIMLVVAFVTLLLSCSGIPARLRVIVGLVMIAGFACMVGLSATVVRASVMAGLYLIAQAFNRTYDLLRALLFAGAVMIAFNPYLLLFDLGFQFSFLATLGLIILAPTFEKALMTSSRLLPWREYLVATVATQLAVLPLLFYYIGEVSLVSIVVNVLVLPMVPIAMLLTFAAGLLALVSPLIALPVAFLAHLSLSYIILIAQWFANLPFAALHVPPISGVLVCMLYGLFALVWWWLTHPKVSNEFSDWTIEDEDKIQKSGAVGVFKTPTAPDHPDTPIFFR